MSTYCNSILKRSRRQTRCVMVGDVGVGGNNPIRLQSMTTTNTMDTEETIEQSIRMIKAGCEIVRITAPSINEAKNLKNIRDGLRSRGFNNPIVADIHFTPKAAHIAAKIVEKVRINPGNYVDRKKFEHHNYSDKSYQDELLRIRDRFIPLLKICKEYGTAMRIGTNHGSLSDRIMSRYGDTPLGMVESAMEFLRIAEDESYYDIILSMKSSNTQVMVQAYRLLVNKMDSENMNYPMHLGVTEAGEAEDGRIKSAVGIGSLLHDGIGDTIRVSLTEEPEAEIPVAKVLVDRYDQKIVDQKIFKDNNTVPYDPFFYKRRYSNQLLNIGGDQIPRVIGDLSKQSPIRPKDLQKFGYMYIPKQDKWHISDIAVDFLYIGKNQLNFKIPGSLLIIQDHSHFLNQESCYPLYNSDEIDHVPKDQIVFLLTNDIRKIPNNFANIDNCILILDTKSKLAYHEQRSAMISIMSNQIENPVIIKRIYKGLSHQELMLYAASDIGGLQIDGLGDGIWLDSDNEANFINETAFGILQASRTRISKTEYISCPSCGRTLFDLQETTAMVRKRTDHLKGIKIGIMGCIVNGPGEMADADYGYVGTGPGLISLYKGQEVVKRNIPSKDAVDALIELIDSNGDWIDPNNL